MKKFILTGIFLFSVSLMAYDGSAGASLNRSNTMEEYERLVELSNKAMNSGSKERINEATEGIKDFLGVIEEYRGVSSTGATRYLNTYEEDMEKRLAKLNNMK